MVRTEIFLSQRLNIIESNSVEVFQRFFERNLTAMGHFSLS